MTMFAFDTETVDGEPYTFQWAGYQGVRRVESIEKIGRKDILPHLFDLLLAHGQENQINVLWAHMLEYDIGVTFIEYPEIWEASRYQQTARWRSVGVTISLHHFDNPFHTIQIGGKKWLILDTMSFFRMSLAKACDLLKLPVRKMSKPRYLGQRKPTAAEWPAFRKYALNDAWAAWELGKYIVACHQEFNIRQSVSGANMASLIFRHHFLGDTRERDEHENRRLSSSMVLREREAISKKFKITRSFRAPQEPRIPFPETTPGSNAVVVASMLAYHGGKNGLYIAPGVYPGVREVDIISAYPHAMKALPPLTEGHWERVDRWMGAGVAGVYQVQGILKSPCPYGPFLTIEGDKKFHSGAFDTWITSWEWESARRHGEVDVKSVVFGYVWVPEAGATNPFSVYVDYFFKRKQETQKDDPKHEMYKLLLNALYGKLIQRADEPDPILGSKVVAGGLFNPFWAAQITGHCRARIHDLEHRYEAIHTSTDSILTRSKEVQIGTGLGDLEVKARGTAIMLRNKLYVLVDPRTKIPVKWALHGFRGKVPDLFRWLKKGGGTYSVHHMWRPREARRTGEKPFRMVRRDFTLNLDPKAVHNLDGGILSWLEKQKGKPKSPRTRSSGRNWNGGNSMSGSPQARGTRSRERSSR